MQNRKIVFGLQHSLFHGNDTNREKGEWSEPLRLDILIKKDSLNIAAYCFYGRYFINESNRNYSARN